MGKFYDNQNFKALQKCWYGVLKTQGFIDDETKSRSPTGKANTLEYYLLLGECIERERFERECDQAVMTLKSQGLKTKHISLIVNRHRKTVMFIIRRFEHKWGIRYWQHRQMTSNRPRPERWPDRPRINSHRTRCEPSAVMMAQSF